MLFANHIRYPLTVSSKPEVNDTIIALWDQVDELTKQLSLVNEQKDRLQEENFDQVTKLTEQNSLLADQNAQLLKENTALVQRVSKLERSVGLNSGNSSKPPSSDGLTKPSAKENRRTQSRRGTSNRKSGGQPGHKGTTLKQVKNPDKVTNHFPLQCQECEAVLSPEESIQSAARLGV